MSRATKLLAGTTVLGFATSIWLYLDNASLRDEVADKSAAVAKTDTTKPSGASDAWLDSKPRDGKVAFKSPTGPSLPEVKKESRLDRRARRTEEFAAMFGRLDGETEEQWRERVSPLISAGLAIPRVRTGEYRKQAEEKAGVTPAQAQAIDDNLNKVYADLIDYTNKSVKDGQVSPYERNVAGWLDYAGGLGGILHEAQGKMGTILRPEQIKAMSDAGFEWGEYIGAQVPWEQIGAPPPPGK